MDELMIGAWTPLLGGRGATLAVANEYTAAAELARLTVWADERRIAQVEAATPAPRRPRISGGRVLWGDGVMELATGYYQRVEAVAAAIVEGTDAPQTPTPFGGYRAATYAWSDDGQALVISAAWTGPPGPPPARVVLVDGSGHHQATLWQESDLAPTAAWVGCNVIVVGTREPRVYDRAGSNLIILSTGTPAVRINASVDETRLLVVEHGRLTVWDIERWTTVGVWTGTWLDAALTPDGRTVVAVGLNGHLYLARVENGLSLARELSLPDQVRGIALGCNRIVAAFASGDAVRTAPFQGS
ncbi:MAG: hypothetical protein OEU26_29915 [Candidatus Tectomicrobia bacterium]|nr:hypothetical protein [Candidatus Tectomicrobia bacterium]